MALRIDDPRRDLRRGNRRVAERYNRALRGRQALAVTAVLAAILLATALRLQGPSPGPSGLRAFSLLGELVHENVPHPVESPANRIVRDRIIERFRSFGYSPVVQRTYSCGKRHRCATVENIVVMPQTPGDIV